VRKEQFNSQFHRQPDKDQDVECDKAVLRVIVAIAAAAVALIAVALS